MICKKDLALSLFTQAILINIQNIYCLKIMRYSCIISHLLSPPERSVRDIQIVIVTNFVVVSSVGIKTVDCTMVSLEEGSAGLQVCHSQVCVRPSYDRTPLKHLCSYIRKRTFRHVCPVKAEFSLCIRTV